MPCNCPRPHVLDDGQAQPGAAGGPRARSVDPVEALEDLLLVLPGDADLLVDDDDAHQILVGGVDADPHAHSLDRKSVV